MLSYREILSLAISVAVELDEYEQIMKWVEKQRDLQPMTHDERVEQARRRGAIIVSGTRKRLQEKG